MVNAKNSDGGCLEPRHPELVSGSVFNAFMKDADLRRNDENYLSYPHLLAAGKTKTSSSF